MEHKELFTPIKIGSLQLSNRIMMSPMFSNSATRDGFVTEKTLKHYEARARADVGLIMTEHTSVNSYYLHPGNRLLISDDKYIAGMSKLAAHIQQMGSKVGLQIAHSIYPVGKKPADLSKDDIYGIIDDFIAGALRAKKAGFDLVEIHLAHTYTLADFVSRRTNRRTDEFGKNIEGRFKIIREIIKGTRQALGKEFPLFARFSADEFTIGGNTLKQTRYYAMEMEKMGIDCLDVSCGVRFDDNGLRGYSDLRGKPPVYMNDAINVHLAEDIKQHVNVPVITVGKLGNPDVAEKVLQDKKADMIAIARQLIADPKWAEKVKKGKKDEIHYCRYCNNCLYKRRGPDDPVVCLDVRKCANCLTCLRLCPNDIPFINKEGKLEFENEEWCEECELCAGICPARLVRFERWPLINYPQRISEAIRKVELELKQKNIDTDIDTVVFYCNKETIKEKIEDILQGNREKKASNFAMVEIPCISRLDPEILLEGFSHGAEKVLVLDCGEKSFNECFLNGQYKLILKRIDKANEMLKEINLHDKEVKLVTDIQALSKGKKLTGG